MKRIDLRTARLRASLSQGQLAEKSGVDQPIISRIENGHVTNPAFDTVYKLAAALDIDPRSLRFGPGRFQERTAS